MLLKCVSLPLFGLLLGFVQLIVLGVLSLLKFVGFGMFMMSSLVGSMLMMLFSVDRAIALGDVSSAWLAWSESVERALLNAFCLAGGPVPEKGFWSRSWLSAVS